MSKRTPSTVLVHGGFVDGSGRYGVYKIPPPAQRQMATRAGAIVVESSGSHAVYVSQPKAVASIIDRAARGVSEPS